MAKKPGSLDDENEIKTTYDMKSISTVGNNIESTTKQHEKSQQMGDTLPRST